VADSIQVTLPYRLDDPVRSAHPTEEWECTEMRVTQCGALVVGSKYQTEVIYAPGQWLTAERLTEEVAQDNSPAVPPQVPELENHDYSPIADRSGRNTCSFCGRLHEEHAHG